MQTINEKKEGDHPYISGYKGRKIGLYAPNLHTAKQAAVVFFKPSKKDAGLLWVELADGD